MTQTGEVLVLKELRKRISAEVRSVGVKPYSHNIIGLILSQINDAFGREAANQAIVDFDLEKLGWKQR